MLRAIHSLWATAVALALWVPGAWAQEIGQAVNQPNTPVPAPSPSKHQHIGAGSGWIGVRRGISVRSCAVGRGGLHSRPGANDPRFLVAISECLSVGGYEPRYECAPRRIRDTELHPGESRLTAKFRPLRTDAGLCGRRHGGQPSGIFPGGNGSQLDCPATRSYASSSVAPMRATAERPIHLFPGVFVWVDPGWPKQLRPGSRRLAWRGLAGHSFLSNAGSVYPHDPRRAGE